MFIEKRQITHTVIPSSSLLYLICNSDKLAFQSSQFYSFIALEMVNRANNERV
jgi:hypothetical protein